MSENKIQFPGFVGSSATQRVGRFSKESTINMYLEAATATDGHGKEEQVYTLVGTPGLLLLQNIGLGSIRGIHRISNSGIIYFVSGNHVYRWTSLTSAPVQIGIIVTTSGYVSIADNGIQVVFVDGTDGFYVTLNDTTHTVIQIVSVNFYPASMVTFQDGYFIFNKVNSINIFISDLYSVNFLALNTAGKTGNSDNITGIITCNKELYVFGNTTTEIWWNSGQSGSTPFVPQEGKFFQVGCVAIATILKVFNSVFWLGENEDGGVVVYEMANDTPMRISNSAVEFSIQNGGGDETASTSYTYQEEGHYFYCVNVPGTNTTWCYDTATSKWAERRSIINGVVGRHLAEWSVYAFGLNIVGDYLNGHLYTYDFNTYTDDGNPILRIRQSPHMSQGLATIFYKLFQIDISPGVGLSNGLGNQITPTVYLEISNDGGETWGQPKVASMGKRGKYFNRCRWQRLGRSRDRVFRVSTTDPVKFNLLSAVLDIEIGTS